MKDGRREWIMEWIESEIGSVDDSVERIDGIIDPDKERLTCKRSRPSLAAVASVQTESLRRSARIILEPSGNRRGRT